MKKLNIENPFFEFMNHLADLVLLNIVWLLTVIPIVTIGAAKSALYRIMLRRARGRVITRFGNTLRPLKKILEKYKNMALAFNQRWPFDL